MSMESNSDPVALFREREEKRAQNNPNANIDERVEQDIIREIRDGKGTLEQKQALYDQLSPEARRSTPTVTNSLDKDQLQKYKDELMDSMLTDPNENTQKKIRAVEDQLENRHNVEPLYKRLGKDDPNLLNARREKLVAKMLSEPNEPTQTEIRDIDEKLEKINSHKPTESQDQPLATPEAVKNKLPLPPEWDLLEEEETNDTDKGDIVITQKEFDEMLEKYDVDEFDTIDLDLEEANNKLKELLEKHAVEPLSSDEAEIMLLIQNAKLKELTKLVTEYMYTDTDRGAVFGNEFYSNQTSQILTSLDQIVQDVRLDTSNTPDEVDFIKKYADLEKQLVTLRENFIKNNFSGVDLAENEAQIEDKIAELFKGKNEKTKATDEQQPNESETAELRFQFNDTDEIDNPKNPLGNTEPHVVVAPVTDTEKPTFISRARNRISAFFNRGRANSQDHDLNESGDEQITPDEINGELLPPEEVTRENVFDEMRKHWSRLKADKDKEDLMVFEQWEIMNQEMAFIDAIFPKRYDKERNVMVDDEPLIDQLSSNPVDLDTMRYYAWYDRARKTIAQSWELGDEGPQYASHFATQAELDEEYQKAAEQLSELEQRILKEKAQSSSSKAA